MELKLKNNLTELSWREALEDEFTKSYFLEMEKKIFFEYKNKKVYPPLEKVFSALNKTPLFKVKVVIIGQDPYHGKYQANGLCFSVEKIVKLPPSLVNIYKELESDLGMKPPLHGDLSEWAQKGVLLLNNQLTVVEGTPMAHKNIGWNFFTDRILWILNEKCEHLVFILWGGPALKKARMIDEKKHFIIKSAHPSPLSSYRGFFGSKPFSKANDYLKKNRIAPINWSLK